MWYAALQFVWSFLFYFVVAMVLVTGIGAWKKFTQEKDKASQAYTAHLTTTPPLPPPLWNTRAASTASTDSYYESESDDEDHSPPPRQPPPGRRTASQQQQAAEKERVREEKEPHRRRGRDDEEPPPPPAALVRHGSHPSPDADASTPRRPRPHDDSPSPASPLPAQDAPSGSSDAEADDDRIRSEESELSDHVSFRLPHFSLSPPGRPRRRRSSSASVSPSPVHDAGWPLASPPLLATPDVVVYREFARVVRGLWVEGVLRQQQSTVERLMEKEREGGKLSAVGFDALRELVKLYLRRKWGEEQEALQPDVFGLLPRRREGEEDADADDLVSAINAAVPTIARASEQRDGARGEGEHQRAKEGEDGEKGSTPTGALTVRLQRLLDLPLPPVHVALSPPTRISVTSPSSTKAAIASPPALEPLPSVPDFDPVALATVYLSNSHSARTSIAQQLCTDRHYLMDALDARTASFASPATAATASASASSPFPALKPVYATPALQTRYLNVELMGEMELVLFRVQRRLEQTMQDSLRHFLTAQSKPSPTASPPPEPMPSAHAFSTPAAAAGAMASPGSSRWTGSAVSPGAPVPALPALHRPASSDTAHAGSPPATTHPTVTRPRAASTTTLNGMPPVAESRRSGQHAPSTPASAGSTAASSSLVNSSPLPGKLKPSAFRTASPAAGVTGTPNQGLGNVRPYPASPFHATTPSLPPRPPSSGGSSPVGSQPRGILSESGSGAGAKRELKQVSYGNHTNGTNGVDGAIGVLPPRLRGHHRSKSLAGMRFSG